MKRLSRFLDKFYEKGYDTDKGVKYCLKILRILVKNPFLVVWLPSNKEKEYIAEFRSESGLDFTITLSLFGDYDPRDYVRYEFGIKCCGCNCEFLEIQLGHIINGIDSDRYNKDESSHTVIMVKGSKIQLKYGHFIKMLYSKVANHLQVVVMQNKLINTIKETLEAVKN